MKVLLNYGTPNYARRQRLNTRTGLRVGGFDRALSCGPGDIDPQYFKDHIEIMSQKRGGGYWLWKPYLLRKTLLSMAENDYLFYADCGSYFIDSIDHLIKTSEEFEQNVMVFSTHYLEKGYTKRDLFLMLDCDHPEYTNSVHREASFLLLKRSNYSLEFIDEYLENCEDANKLTDSPNVLGLENYPEFVDHRHDQSILSLLSKKHKIPAFRAPTQFGNEVKQDYPNSDYPQILVHRRLPLKERVIRRAIRTFYRLTGVEVDMP